MSTSTRRVDFSQGVLYSSTYGGVWLEGLSQKPQNIYSKIVILKMPKSYPLNIFSDFVRGGGILKMNLIKEKKICLFVGTLKD